MANPITVKAALLFTTFLAYCGSVAGGETVVRSNGLFTVTWNRNNGGLDSLVFNKDGDRMNWIDGTGTWGETLGYSAAKDGWSEKFAFCGISESGESVVSRYRFGKTMELEVDRRVCGDYLEEKYTFKNVAPYPVYIGRGHLGVFATFNDNYTRADVCEKLRCHAHLWPYGECAWVHAKKMGPGDMELSLVLTEGELDGYSVRRIKKDFSNDRGDFVLHPAPFVLLPGKIRSLSWRIVPVEKGGLGSALIKNGSADISFRNETIFPGEDFEIDVTGPDGVTKRHVFKADRGVGEYPFWFDVGGKRAFARGRCSRPFADIVKRRVDFIVSNQQCLDRESPLFGAYLIYDNEEKRQHYDEVWCDHNACRERMGMAMLIARYLQSVRDEKVYASLILFEEFVLREFFDEHTGAVFNAIGKDPAFKRLYNAPWMITFFSEMYRLKREGKYLDWIERAIMDYYRKGGAVFYPNGCTFADAIDLLKSCGRDVEALKKAAGVHVGNLLRNSIVYPPHEVKFEQTIATVPVAILSDWTVKIERKEEILSALRPMVDVLTRFDGNQPDHRLNSLPIRHWDSMWFGKHRIYGDTHHYWSVLSGNAYLIYSKATGDESFRKKAEKCFRNCLWPFFDDGSASSSYVHPFSVTLTDGDGVQIELARQGESFDAFANDQDYALYFILRSGLMGAK